MSRVVNSLMVASALLATPVHSPGATGCVDYGAELHLAFDECSGGGGGQVVAADGYAYHTHAFNPSNFNRGFSSGGTWVLDISNPYDIQQVDFFTDVDEKNETAWAYGEVAVGYGILAAATRDSVWFSPSYDVAGPISFVSGLSVGGWWAAGSRAVVGPDHVYMVTTQDDGEHLRVIDVSNLAAPAFVADLPLANEARALVWASDHLYVARLHAIDVIDVSDPTQPTLLPPLGLFPVDPIDLAGAGDLLVAAGESTTVVIDISSPSSPIARGSLDAPSRPRVAMEAQRAYLGLDINGWGGLKVVDLANPDAPAVETYSLGWPSIDAVALWGDVLFAPGYIWGFGAPGCGLSVFALGERRSDAVIASEASGSGSNLARYVDHVYTAGSEVSIFDVSDPSDPVAVGSLPNSSQGVYVAAGRLYVTRGAPGFDIYDLADPVNPTFIGAFTAFPALALHIDTSNAVAYVGESGGFHIVSISDPEIPVLLGTSSSNRAREIIVDGDLAYLVYYDRGLQIVDVSEPIVPIEVSSLLLPSMYSTTLEKIGNLVYLGSTSGLSVVDVADPTNPTVLTTVPVGAGGPRSIAADKAGRLLYASERLAVSVLSLDDPAVPVFIGGTYLRDPSPVLVDDHLFTYASRNDEGGLTVLEPHCAAATSVAPGSASPPSSAALRAFPSPMRGSLAIRFEGATAGTPVARIYDVNGRLVDAVHLVSDRGAFVGRWDAAGRAAGVYFVRVVAPGGTVTRRVVRVHGAQR